MRMYQREKQKEEEKAFIRRIQKDVDSEIKHSEIKRKSESFVRSRIPEVAEKEITLKIIAYNIRRINSMIVKQVELMTPKN